ncbi:hypothetical protein IC762_12700 [Bradyrhizobium genosp. L]|uniref:hypothetical protein n=1 Tax=Bradyrhizobium genosp. L TaxID=83637 RepID=UPI0018A321C4|nr:hypothetical protein [Bradyrhizobium genosp. L]QPF87100.1 hypothetical protein IC762_12700 [Bradyrhizobium genosp. L]
MKRFAAIYLALTVIALTIPAGARAQGVNDPSTPNHNVIIVNPSQPARPNATRNIPTGIQAPPVVRGRARVYHGPRTRGSGTGRR